MAFIWRSEPNKMMGRMYGDEIDAVQKYAAAAAGGAKREISKEKIDREEDEEVE